MTFLLKESGWGGRAEGIYVDLIGLTEMDCMVTTDVTCDKYIYRQTDSQQTYFYVKACFT